jgi:hypothetical protein
VRIEIVFPKLWWARHRIESPGRGAEIYILLEEGLGGKAPVNQNNPGWV